MGDERDLAMEQHLAALGLWYRLGGFALAALGTWLELEQPIFACLMPIGAGLAVLGHYIGRRNDAARIIAGVLTIVLPSLALLAWSFGSALSGLFAWDSALRTPSPDWREYLRLILVLASFGAMLRALLSARASRICRIRYREAFGHPRVRWWRSPLFVGLALALVIGIAVC
jgi:hypothetical protein